jgi:hypothetical protein
VKGVRIPSVAHSDIDANLRRRREMYKGENAYNELTLCVYLLITQLQY